VPTYEYRCKSCAAELEVVQSFTDDALTTCEACGGPLRKVFGSVGISFKGSGFYKTDSRGGSSSSADGGSKDTPPKDAGAGSSDSSSTSNGKDKAATADKGNGADKGKGKGGDKAAASSSSGTSS
jgi:putative FmdB family regulatory protein